jgi:hypothetical protein
MKPLTNFEINDMLENVANFKGTFMSDTLPTKIETNSSYVVNLDKNINQGTHWVAIYNDPKNDYVEYFDSYGMPPNTDTEEFLHSSDKSVKFNTSALQHLLSKSCGYFAAWYIMERSKGKSQYDVLYSMDQSNALINEMVIKKIFHL